MTEARWLNNNYIPTTEEYMHVSSISCCYPLLITTSYIGMGDTAAEDIFNWVTNEPKILHAASVLCRLMDDVVSSEVSLSLSIYIPKKSLQYTFSGFDYK